MYLFQQLRQAGKAMNFNSSAEAREWYRQQAADMSKVDQQKIMDTAEPFKIFKGLGAPSIGKMFMFSYDAKHKATLPFFDRFPLVFPIEFYNDGFLGINLHYLPQLARAQLMDALHTITTNDKYNYTTKLQISYRLLKTYGTKFAGFEQCVKRYLFSHVRSSFHYVNPSDWDKALMLPLQSWHVNSNPKYAGRPPS